MESSTFLALLLTLLKTSDCANILAVFPTASYSHQVSCQGVSLALARRGHNVTVITTDPIKEKIENYTEIGVRFVYKVWEKYQKEHKFNIQQKRHPFEALYHFEYVFANYMDSIYSSELVQRIIKSPDVKFDLVLYEGLYPAALGLAKHFNVPSVVMFTVPTYFTVQSAMGNPIYPSYMPSFISDSNDNMKFTERISNIVNVVFHQVIQNFYAYPLQDAVIRKHFGEQPPVKELERNNSLLILSGDMSQGYPSPHQPNTIRVGTLHITPRKPLPDDLKLWMDGAEAGIIYFSLGSNMRGTSLPEKYRNAFIKVFEKFPRHRILWKWESDTPFPGKPDNVLLRKWISQQDVLAHPKMQLFIMQGGHQSRQEATHFGVPLLIIPLFWDQDFNARQIVTAGAGLSIQIKDITFDNLYQKMNAVLNVPSYKENMKRLSAISHDQPMDGPDTAAWWIEYVIRHKGAPHLRPAVHNLYWYQLYCLDILALFLSISALTLYAVYTIYSLVYNYNSSKKVLKVKNVKVN